MRKRPLGPKAEEQVLFPSKATAALSGRTGGGREPRRPSRTGGGPAHPVFESRTSSAWSHSWTP